MVLRVPRPWPYGGRLAVEVRGVRNVSGASGNAAGVIAVPERPKVEPKDTTRARPSDPRRK
jgi:hypothetical protein